MTEGTAEGLDHQGSVHALIQLPAHHATAEQIDPDSEIPPAGAGADVRDAASPATVESRGLDRFSTTPTAPLLALEQGLKALRVLALSSARRISRATRWRPTWRPEARSS